METALKLYVFNCKFKSFFITKDRLVLRSVIHKRTLDVLHKGNKVHIKHEKRYLYNTFKGTFCHDIAESAVICITYKVIEYKAEKLGWEKYKEEKTKGNSENYTDNGCGSNKGCIIIFLLVLFCFFCLFGISDTR